ncbi:hypothetical protein BVIET440_50114 [Burkholderia vietnamiensis]
MGVAGKSGAPSAARACSGDASNAKPAIELVTTKRKQTRRYRPISTPPHVGHRGFVDKSLAIIGGAGP